MLIEFTGLPGSGKTTLEKALLTRLQVLNIEMGDRKMLRHQYIKTHLFRLFSTRLSDYSQFYRKLFSPFYTSKLLPYAARLNYDISEPKIFYSANKQRAQKVAETLLLNDFYLRHYDPKASLITLSEGFFHTHSAILAFSKQNINKNICTPPNNLTTIIHVDTPIDIAAERLSKRHIPQFWEINNKLSEIIPILERYQQATALCLDLAAQRGFTILKFDMAQDISQSEKALRTLVTDLKKQHANSEAKAKQLSLWR